MTPPVGSSIYTVPNWGLFGSQAAVPVLVGPPEIPATPSGFTRQVTVDYRTAPLISPGGIPIIKGGAQDGYIDPSSALYPGFGSLVKFYPNGTPDTYGKSQAWPSQNLGVSLVDGVHVLDVTLQTADPGTGTPVAMAAWSRAFWPDGNVNHLYGRMVTCWKATDSPGYGMVSLAIGSSTVNEMDWAEKDLGAGVQFAGNHHVGTSNPNPGAPHHFPDDGRTNPDSTDWHYTTTEWTPSGVRYLLDTSLQYTSTDVASTALKWIYLQSGSMQSTTAPSPSVFGHLYCAWSVLESWDG